MFWIINVNYYYDLDSGHESKSNFGLKNSQLHLTLHTIPLQFVRIRWALKWRDHSLQNCEILEIFSKHQTKTADLVLQSEHETMWLGEMKDWTKCMASK